MRVERSIIVSAPPKEVWRHLGEPTGYPRIFAGVTRFEAVGEQDSGLGARFAMRMRVGPAEVGGLIEIVECDEERDLAWTSITGIEQRGRLRLRRQRGGTTRITARISWQSPGGVWGVIADRVAARTVGGNLARTLETVRRLAEHRQPEPSDVAEPPGLIASVGSQADAVRILAEAGLLRPARPDRLPAMMLAIARWGFTPAAGYAVSAARYPDAVAIVDDAGTLTFGEVQRRTDAIAASLGETGIGEGSRVGILCRNHRGFIESLLAVTKLGADALLLNTSFAGPQLRDVLRAEGAAAIIHDEEFTESLSDTPDALPRFLAWSEAILPDVPTLDDLAGAGDGRAPSPPERTGRLVVLTSGTTGRPKGASRSNPTSLDPVVAFLSRIPLRARGTTVVAPPLFHAWGLAHLMLGTMLSSTLVLQRRFDPEAVLEAACEHDADVIVAVPVMLQRILEVPARKLRSLHPPHLRIVAVSGSALSGALAQRFMDEFGDVVYNLYGSTEVAWVSIATPDELRVAPGTAGRPPRGTIVRLFDEDGVEVPQGQVGRIAVANEMLFEGYSGGGDKDRVAGLMLTGDRGRFDDRGLLYVEGRDDDMIVSGGENVFPAEVEELLGSHPDVGEVAVVGVEDEQFGQRLAAYVVPKGGKRNPEALKSHVKAHLAGYKVPRDIVFVSGLPRSDAGKVVKRKLTEDGAAGDAAAGNGDGRSRASGRAAPKSSGRSAPKSSGRAAAKSSGRAAPKSRGRAAPTSSGRAAAKSSSGRTAAKSSSGRTAAKSSGRAAPTSSGRAAPASSGRAAAADGTAPQRRGAGTRAR